MKTSKQILDELFRMLYPILEDYEKRQTEKQLKEILDKNRITVKEK